MAQLAKNKVAWLIGVGSLVWSLTMMKSGWVYGYGMGFWGPNAHDGLWHVALINNLTKGSLEMPIFAGEMIKNYHLGFDLVMAGLVRLTGIPTINLYFQIVPPIIAVAIGLLTFKLTRNMWSVFFVYFGGSLGWLVGQGESAFWSQQAISTLINPPYALSLAVFLLGLLAMQNKRYWLAIVIFAILPQIKIYAGILAFIGLLASRNFKVLLISSLLAAALFLPLNRQVTSLIVFQPGWFLENLFSPEHLNWPRFFSALNTYRLGQIWWKGIPAYVLALGIFLIGNLGTRIIGLTQWRGKDLGLWAMIIVGIFLPMLWVQTGTTWNTIQFFYYSQFFLSILAGKVLTTWPKYLQIIVLVVTLPTTLQTLGQYLPMRPPAAVPAGELQALEVLRRQPEGVVLTYPVTKQWVVEPRPLYYYESTAYVSALAQKSVFLEDEVNLNITGYAWQERRRQAEQFFQSGLVSDQRIKYVYLPKVYSIQPPQGFITLFENSQAVVLVAEKSRPDN